MARDYIPRPHAGFAIFENNLMNAVAANATGWNIPADEVDALQELSDAYNEAYKPFAKKHSRTKVHIQNYMDARAEHETHIRYFVNAFVRSNKQVDDSMKVTLGIPVKKKRRRERSVIQDLVWLMITESRSMMMYFKCRVPEKEGRASIHAEADAVELRYSIGSRPASVDETTHSFISSKAGFRIAFNHKFRGQYIYVYARWKNMKNDALSGPWNDVSMDMIS